MIMDYFAQQILLRRRTGRDGTGAATYASPISCPARVQQRRRVIRDVKGEQQISDMQVFLSPSLVIGEGDRITYGGGTYHVMGVTEEFALDQMSHKVAWTGRVGD